MNQDKASRMVQVLHRLIPASKQRVTDIRTVIPDYIADALVQQGADFRFERFPYLLDWELENSDATDDEIFKLLNMHSAGHAGELLICTEACTRYGYDALSCDAAELEKFIIDYDIGMFFEGDVVMVCESSRTLTLFHHAGGYVHVKL
jgi:hypothetical protein